MFPLVVPVELWSSTPPTIAAIESESSSSTALAIPGQGCHIDGQAYTDGMQIPRDPDHPCQLCYCIRNHTACIMQECSLKVPGCKPVHVPGECCPVKYECGEYNSANDKVGTGALRIKGNGVSKGVQVHSFHIIAI
jgi:hypothetical protein